MKKLIFCPNFNVNHIDEEIKIGDMVVQEIALGPLHEICLLSHLDIPNLDDEI